MDLAFNHTRIDCHDVPEGSLANQETVTLTTEEAAHQARAIAARSSVTADDVAAVISEMRERPA